MKPMYKIGLKAIRDRYFHQGRYGGLRTIKNLVVCFADHFEPGNGDVGEQEQRLRMDLLMKKFPGFSERHLDTSGNPLHWSWFFPPHYHFHGHLAKLVSLAERGLGEIELHLHHGKTQPDTSENLEATLRQCVQEYSQMGVFGKYKGQSAYGFIHGDWALNNSIDNKYCGVNNELEILQRTGCYADMTMPCAHSSMPGTMNRHLYADVRVHKPKGYEAHRIAHVGKKPQAWEFPLLQGPVAFVPDFQNGKPNLAAGNPSITIKQPLSRKRLAAFARCRVHVEGRPETVFLKLHTHSAPIMELYYNEDMDRDFWELEALCRENQIRLHYVTAREFFNIFKAVEDDQSADHLEDYRDYMIEPPAYDVSHPIECASPVLQQLISKTYNG